MLPRFPSAALAILEGWEKQGRLDIRRGEWLDRTHGVVKKDGRIVSIKTLSGNVYRGEVFIDATYEGDLMAAAGEEMSSSMSPGGGFIIKFSK